MYRCLCCLMMYSMYVPDFCLFSTFFQREGGTMMMTYDT